MMRLPAISALSALVLPTLLTQCAETADYRPVSAGTLAKLDAQVVSKAQFVQMLRHHGTRPAAPVTLPLFIVAGLPTLDVQIGSGGKVPMMLDTGASRTMIQANLAVKKKLPILNPAEMTVEMKGVIGSEKGRVGLLDPLILGTWAVHDYPCFVRTYESRFLNLVDFPESLLGFDLAHQHCTYLTLDYRRNKVVFGFGESYAGQVGPRTSKTPFTVKQGVPFITVKSGGTQWEAIVDSGSFNGVEINEEIATRLNLQGTGEKIEGLHLAAIGDSVTSAEVNMRRVRLKELRLLSGTYRDAEVDISPGHARIGSRFLMDYRVTFDFKRKLLWLEW